MNFRAPFLPLVVLASISGVRAEPQEPEQFLGKKMPAFSMVDLSGKRLTNTNLKGKVVVLDFWASWCVTCRRVSPIMEDLHKKYASKGLVVIGTDVAEKKKGTAARYSKMHHYTYKFTENNDKLAETLGVVPLPTVIVIDRKGIVRKVQGNYYNGMDVDMDKTVASLLAEKA